MLIGKHLIAGKWVGANVQFENMPVDGRVDRFAQGDSGLVDEAAKAADEAYPIYAGQSRRQRAAFLRTIAHEIEARGKPITQIAMRETGLPEARLEGERGRTVAQLRLFADHIEKGDYLDKRHDTAQPDRQPLPRPDLRLIQMPTGPIGVFGASNFPLAFSVAGGDTASALAAGCPVVVKGHEAHPGTGDLVAQAIEAAIRASGVPAGVFSLVQGGGREVGEALVQHPLIAAIGFTGSLRAGRALFDLCAARPDPIPFFGELGSINPMFVLPQALAGRSKQIAEGWVASLTLGAGQFCTKPGLAILQDGHDAEQFIAAAKRTLETTAAQTMLTDGIAQAYDEGRASMVAISGVREVISRGCPGRQSIADLFEVSAQDWLANPALSEEVFGPFGLVVRVSEPDQMATIARALPGQLTCTLQMDSGDESAAQALLPTLTRKAGRLLANGFSTGVEVTDAMVHGGPYPASTNFGATSVGTMAIRRWLRPVCFQNVPPSLLPDDAR